MSFIYIIGVVGLSVLILFISDLVHNAKDKKRIAASSPEVIPHKEQPLINDSKSADNCETDTDSTENHFFESSDDAEINSDRYIYARIRLSNELAPVYTQQFCDNYERCFAVPESHKPRDFFCGIYYAFSILLTLQSCYENISQYCRFNPFDEYARLSTSLDAIINEFLVDSFEREKTKLDSLKTAKGKRNNYNRFIEDMDAAFVEAKQPYEAKDLPKYTGQIITENNISVLRKLKIELQRQLPLLPDELEQVKSYVRSQPIECDHEHNSEVDAVRLKAQFEYEKEKLRKERAAGYSGDASIYLPFKYTILNQAIEAIKSRCPNTYQTTNEKEINDFFAWLIENYNVSEEDISAWKNHLLSELNEETYSNPLLKAMKIEKSGNPEDLAEAMKCYEEYVQAGFTGTTPYDRLMVIYRRNKDYTNEQRIIRAAIVVYEKELTWLSKSKDIPRIRIDGVNETLDKWKKRLEKSQKLQEKGQKNDAED